MADQVKDLLDDVRRGIRFRQDFDAWWPDYDHAPETCFRFVQRGLNDAVIAARQCVHRRVCVQAGAHAGFWPRKLSTLFRKVYAFECEPALFACAELNLKRWRISNVDLRQVGLGSEPGSSMMVPHRSAGSWSVDPRAGTVPIDLTTIDALDLAACDAIYLDIEGYETEALAGAARTINRFRPVIHLEELPEHRNGIRVHMTAIGYRLLTTVHKDAVYLPEERMA